MFLTNEDVRAKLPRAATNRIAALRQKKFEPEHRDVHGTMVTTMRLDYSCHHDIRLVYVEQICGSIDNRA